MTTRYLLPALALLLLTACSDRAADVSGPGRVDTVYIADTSPETGVDSGFVMSGTAISATTVLFRIDTAYLDTLNHMYTGALYVDYDYDLKGLYIYSIQEMYITGNAWNIKCAGTVASFGYFKMPWIKKRY